MKTMLIAATALALAGTAALAQTSAPSAASGPMADGAMTRDEVVAKVRDHFSRFDADRDGAISTAEIGARHRRMGARKMAEGGSPQVMIRKHGMHDPNAAFDRLDANKDGMISRDEFAKGREMRIEKRVVRREKIRKPVGTESLARCGRTAWVEWPAHK